MKNHTLSLKSILGGGAVWLGLLGVTVIVALVLLTDYLNKAVSDFNNSLEMSEWARETERNLLIHNRESLLYNLTKRDEHLIARESAVAALLAMNSNFEMAIQSPLLAAEAKSVHANIKEYLKMRENLRSKITDPLKRYIEATEPLDKVRSSVKALSDMIREQANQNLKASVRHNEIANNLGNFAFILLLLSLLAATALALLYIYRPIMAFYQTISNFGSVKEGAMAEVRGTKEIRAISLKYNELVARLQNQRSSQMTYLATLAHDLRNPVTSIKLAAEMILGNSSSSLSPSDKETVGIIDRQTSLLDNMTEDLLDSSRIETGQFDLQLSDRDLNELISDAIQLVKAAFQDRKIESSLTKSRLPVLCDPTLITRVINNLLSNSLKYSPDDKKVEVKTWRENDWAMFSIKDQGEGISPEDKEKVFEPFKRVDRIKSTLPGYGLGLSASRSIIERHGGSINIESSIGYGTTVIVGLKLQC